MLSCPVCASTAQHSFDSEYVAVAACNTDTCGHLFAEAVPSDFGVQRVGDPDGLAEQFRARNANLIAYLDDQKIVGAGRTVLDFGTGVGHLAGDIAATYPTGRVICIEAEASASARLRARGLEVVEDLTDVEDGSVDAVMMVEVIEHLDDPVAIAAVLRAKLKPGGRMFVTTPVGRTRKGSTETNAYSTPEHVQFFTEKSLALALTKAGFNRVRFVTLNAMYPPGVGLKQRTKAVAKNIVRPLWSRVFGPRHLVVIAS